MKNLKYYILPLLAIISLSFSSCSKDEDETTYNISINDLELGTSNSKTGYLGAGFHIEAAIIAEAKIKNIKILIHQEENETASSWTFDSTYTSAAYSGVINCTFHEHITVPSNVSTGNYHFHITITDMNGNTKTVEEEMTIQTSSDVTSPSITVDYAPTNGQTFSNGQTISISGTIADNVALGGIYVALVKESQGLENSAISSNNTITLLHNHEFANPNSYSFNASIVVGATQDNNTTPKTITGDFAWASGNWYLLVKVPDTAGNITCSAKYPLVINY